MSQSRFVIKDSAGPLFSLPDGFPWPPSGLPRKVAFRIGTRSVLKAYRLQRSGIREFIERVSSAPARTVLGFSVRISAQVKSSKSILGDDYLIVDLWTEGKQANSSVLRDAGQALQAASKEVTARFDLLVSQVLEPKQEFFELRLPRRLAKEFSLDRAHDVIQAHVPASFNGQVSTVNFEEGLVSVGPEPPGPIEALQKYLKEEGFDKKLSAAPEASTSQRLISAGMSFVLVVTWALPLRWWSLALVGTTMILLMSSALWPARTQGFRIVIQQGVTLVTVGFFFIGIFGLLYALCALRSDEAFGRVTRLGYPFLFSTSLGVAGGIMGEPKGVARVIAHTQLLLFMSALISVIAVILGLRRKVRQQG